MGAIGVFDRSSDAVSIDGEYDVIIDPVAGPDIGSFIGRLRNNGRYVICGVAGGPPPPTFGIGILQAFHKSASVMCFSLDTVELEHKHSAAGWIWEQCAQHRLIPVVDKTYALEEASDAHRRMESGSVFGKVILEIK